MPLLSVPFAALVGWAAATGVRWLYGALLAFVVASTAMNMRFMPSDSYYHRDFCLRLPFSRAEHTAIAPRPLPSAKSSTISIATTATPRSSEQDSSIAGLDADIFENHWHQITNYWRIRDMKTVPQMIQLMQSWGIEYFISPNPILATKSSLPSSRRCSTVAPKPSSKWATSTSPGCSLPAVRARSATPSSSARDGTTTPTLRSSSAAIGPKINPSPNRLATPSPTPTSPAPRWDPLRRQSLHLRYTKAPNRGMASVTIDGTEQPAVDLYSPKIEWQSSTRFCCFPFGRHTAIIKLTGRSDPHSTGTFVDLDFFTIE